MADEDKLLSVLVSGNGCDSVCPFPSTLGAGGSVSGFDVDAFVPDALALDAPAQFPDDDDDVDDDDDDDVMMKKKLAEKAAKARRGRLRRKQYINGLERTVRKQELRIGLLRVQEERARKRQTSRHDVDDVDGERLLQILQNEQDGIIERLRALDDVGALEELVDAHNKGADVRNDLMQNVVSMLNDFVLISTERQSKFEVFLDGLLRCIQPGNEAKFATWLLSRGDEFYSSEGIWQSLVQELEITDQQTRMLLTRRGRLHELEAESQRLRDHIEEIRIFIREMLFSQNLQLKCIVDVTSPIQAARICAWVNRQTWCMELLSSVFGKFLQTALDDLPEEAVEDLLASF